MSNKANTKATGKVSLNQVIKSIKLTKKTNNHA